MRSTLSYRLASGSTAGESSPDVHEVQIAGYEQSIRLRLYRYSGARDLPVLLYFHGGAFVRGCLDDADVAACRIAERLPALVVSVDYSLAPKHPFPAALEDAYCAARWVDTAARTLGASGKNLFVAGHCAGGNIANGLSFVARDRGEIRIQAQALFSPMLDPSMTCLPDERRVASDLTASQCAASYRAYLPRAAHRIHPYAAPLESARLSGLPPTFIATAQNDLLYMEAEEYAARLASAGVPTQVLRYASASHEQVARALQPLNDAICFFQTHLNNRPAVSGH
jgi:acetyl esterase